MALSIFDDKAVQPDEPMLKEVLGRSSAAWEGIRDYLIEKCGGITEDWAHSGVKWGWSLRLVHKKRRIVYLTPQARSFLFGMVLGDRAVAAAREAGLPDEVMEVIDNAPRYGEGTGLRLEVRYKKQLPALRKLLDIKLANWLIPGSCLLKCMPGQGHRGRILKPI